MQKKFRIALVLVLLICLQGCGKKTSEIEGKIVDWNGEPAADVIIMASQVNPVEDYEQFEVVTDANGMFRINGLFPSSEYVLTPWSDEWVFETEVKVSSPPKGKVTVLSPSLVIVEADFEEDNEVSVQTTEDTRFTISSDGVITDSKTGLEWLVGPDSGPTWDQARAWVKDVQIDGGGWRIPSRSELEGICQIGVGTRNLDPIFETTGWFVWAGSKFLFPLDAREEGFLERYNFGNGVRVFAVRYRS